MTDMAETERDRVERWHRHCFLEMTKSEKETEWLLLAGVDPHDLEPLLRLGCPLKLAKRILRPV